MLSSHTLKRLLVSFTCFGLALGCGQSDTSPNESSDIAEAKASNEIATVQRASRDIRREQSRNTARLEAQQAARTNATTLEFVNYTLDLDGQTPLACLGFSLPLNPETDYTSYVETAEETPISLNVDGQKLCVGGLNFGSETTLTLREGLPDLDGNRILQANEDVLIAFDNRPPYVGFSGNGIILPRASADGLALETVNVSEVNVEIRHVTDRSLVFKRLTKGITVAPGDYGYIRGQENPYDLAAPVWSGSIDTTGTVNTVTTTVFPIQSLLDDVKSGAYYINIKDAKSADQNRAARAERWLLVTDLALTAYRSDAALDVVLRSLQDGSTIQGVETQLLAENNEVLATSETGIDGRARFDGALLKGGGNLRPALVIAYGKNGDIALLDLRRAPIDLSEELPAARVPNAPVDSYIYTERGIYRPGETVHITGLVRARNGDAMTQETGHVVIYRPNGVEALRQRFDDSMIGGSVSVGYALPQGSARGVWRAALFTDRHNSPAGEVRFSVEDFVPQRVKIDLKQPENLPLSKGDSTLLETQTLFLYGAPGAGLNVETSGRLEIDPNPFADKAALKGFSYGDPEKTFRERFLEFGERTADGEGNAVFEIGAGARAGNIHRPLRLNINVAAMEPGGRAVTESIRVPYRPRTRYIGVKADEASLQDRETPANFSLALLNNAGQIMRGQMTWDLIRIDYQYDWYREDGRWRYRRSRSAKIVNSGVVNSTNAIEQLVVNHDWDWGRYALQLKGPRGSKATYGFWVGWHGGSDDGVEAPDRVQISTEESAAQVGREAVISFKSPFKGEAQIVVATDRVLSITEHTVDADVETIRLPVGANWGEGAYVMVNVFSKRDPVADPKPRRAVGVQYIPVDTSTRTFDVAIDAPERTTPRTQIEVDVRVADGPKRESVYMTLAAVDEGILRITKYSSPDPVKHYFSPKSLGVDLLDDYGRLLNPNLGLPAEIRSGGDQLGGEGLSAVPTESVALFSGVVLLKNGRAQVPLDLPDFNGDLRLMAVVWSETGLGKAQANMIVRDKAPTTLVMPRFLAPGDKAIATLSIDNIDLAGGEFKTNVSAAGGVSVQNSEVIRSLDTGQRGDEAVDISSDQLGISELTVNVRGPENFAVRHEYKLQTRTPYLPVTRLQTQFLSGDDDLRLNMDMVEGLMPDTITAELAFSALPIDEVALFRALEQYPYGCTEQTVSRAAPLVYAKTPNGNAALPSGLNPEVQKAIATLLDRQGRKGAIHLWRADDNLASPWLGAYTVDFLARAKARGYVVPRASFENALDSLRPIANGNRWDVYGYDAEVMTSEWHTDSTSKLMNRASAYALYVLAKEGRGDASRMRYLHDRELAEIESPLARAQLGAGLAIIGDRVRAKSAFDGAIAALGYDNTGDYYQTPLRDLAGILALAVEANFPDVTSAVQEKLSQNVRDPQNLSTQEKAFLLFALGAIKSDSDSIGLTAEGFAEFKTGQTRFNLSLADLEGGASFSVTEDSQAFATLLVMGVPNTAPPPVSEQLSIAKNYYTLWGERVDVSRVNQGDLMVVELVLEPKQKRLNPVIVADLLPAGFEIEGVLGYADGVTEYGDQGAVAWLGKIDEAATKQAQDDRFVAAIDMWDQPVRLAYMVRAVTQGEFTLPGAVAEDMYRADVFARSAASRTTVVSKNAQAGGEK